MVKKRASLNVREMLTNNDRNHLEFSGILIGVTDRYLGTNDATYQ